MGWFHLLSRGKGIDHADRQRLLPLEKAIRYHFRNPRLLKRALTHKSYVNENNFSSFEQNERYEFLGDAVLELAISHLMMEKFPEFSEGDLSKLRAAVVNETRLAELARLIHLGKYLYLGRGEDQCQGREKDSLLSNAYEATLGAIFLDRGFASAFRVIKSQFRELLSMAGNKDITMDYKTRLQEVSQDKFRQVPRYLLRAEVGPDHDKTFEVELIILDKIFGRGKGKSKKEAEQEAAKEALERLETGE